MKHKISNIVFCLAQLIMLITEVVAIDFIVSGQGDTITLIILTILVFALLLLSFYLYDLF